jgi:hypothetical protein
MKIIKVSLALVVTHLKTEAVSFRNVVIIFKYCTMEEALFNPSGVIYFKSYL